MSSLNDLRNRVIEKVKLTKDEKDLAFLDDLLSKINSTEVYTYSSTEEQLLKLAEEDISYGRVISQEELDKQDEDWMKSE